ncbi:hypothetical protein BDN67DRAFT_986180, partial [Paxillus ammoniavirescens]
MTWGLGKVGTAERDRGDMFTSICMAGSALNCQLGGDMLMSMAMATSSIEAKVDTVAWEIFWEIVFGHPGEFIQTWLHRRGAAIEAALACLVLESQKAKFVELLMAEGHQISAFIAAYPNSNNLSIDPSLAKLILQCQASQSVLTVLTSMSDSSWAEKPKAQPSDVSHVPLPATQQWWRPFHEAAQKQVFLSPTAGVESSDADHFQYLRKTHKDLRERLIFADSELRRNSDKVHTMLAAQVTVNLLKERNTDLQERVENSEALAAVQREELQDLHCQLAELESLSTGAPMPDISYP